MTTTTKHWYTLESGTYKMIVESTDGNIRSYDRGSFCNDIIKNEIDRFAKMYPEWEVSSIEINNFCKRTNIRCREKFSIEQ